MAVITRLKRYGYSLILRSSIRRMMAFGLGIAIAFVMSGVGSPAAFAQNEDLAFWGQASFPVENFQLYTSAFGYRSSGFHYGLDIAAPQGSYVRNWSEGEVVEISDHTACGTMAIIQSGPWEHRYCHMNGHVEASGGKRYLVDTDGGVRYEQGQILATGDRLGRVGMTGRTTGPHLHWMMKYGGEWVDPGAVLQAMYTAQQSG